MSLSQRCEEIRPQSSFLQLLMESYNLPVDESFAHGFINLCISENSLSMADITQRISKLPPPPRSELAYDIMHGSDATRTTVAAFLSKYVTKTSISESQVAILNGASSVIEALATVICDDGDKLILQGPGYRGFGDDVSDRAGVGLVIANMDDDAENPPLFCMDAVEKAWEEEGGDNSRIRGVLFSSPVNPTGEVLSRDTLCEIVSWCRERGLHAIFSEVYALSVHDGSVKFVSVAEALDGDLRDDVHIAWSMSKDMCISGARVGVLVTKNEQLMLKIARLATLWTASRCAQWLVRGLLNDWEWVDGYVQRNRQRLKTSYEYCTSELTRLGVGYMKGQAGFFLWVDIRKWMKRASKEEEMQVLRSMFKKRFLLSPASEVYGKHIGFFRLCFAGCEMDVLKEAMKRLEALLKEMSSLQLQS